MATVDDIRKNLNKAIADSGLSRLKVTERAGISYQHLTRFLNNSTGGEIGIGILQKLSDVLNVPVSYLLGDTDKDGVYTLTSDGKKLPEDWDLLFKRVLKMDKNGQEKIHKILSLFLDTIE